MDRRPVSDGPLFCATHSDGGEHVLHAEAEPGTARSHAGKNHAVDANCLHLFLFMVPGGLGALLALQQLAVNGTAIPHQSPN